MLAPQAVHGRDDDAALEGPHRLLAQLGDGQGVRVQALLGVGVHGVDVAHELGHQVLAHQRRAAAVLLLDLLEGHRRRVVGAQVLPQGLQVPLVDRLVGDRLVDQAGDERLHEQAQLGGHVLALQDLAAFAVDRLALARHDVVVLEDVLADLRVAGLHLVLGGGDGAGHEAVLQRHVLGVGPRRHDALGHARVEQAHQVVLHGQVEAGLARIPLAAATAAQLVVDAPRLVALRAQHVQPAELAHLLALGLDGLLRGLQGLGPGLAVLLGVLLGVQALGRQVRLRQELRVAAQHDVRSTAGHVRGHRDRALAARHRDDRRLAGVLLGVEHLVGDVARPQHLRQELGLLDRGGADQDRLPLLVALLDVVDDRPQFPVLRGVDEVGLVLADHRLVRGDRHDGDLVRARELGRLGLGGAGHAGPRALRVEAEVVLQGDGRQGLVLRLDLHALLGLDGLVHAVVVAAPGQHAARVLVDDEDLAAVDDVVLVEEEQLLGADRVVEEADEGGVRRLVQVLDAQLVLDLVDAGLQDADGLLLLVDLVVLVALEQAGDARELHVPAVEVPVGGTGDDQGRARLVDEDGVDLVDDHVGVPALDQVLGDLGHVVAQVVEAELVVRAVGDVHRVHLAPLGGGLADQDAPAAHAQEGVDAAHQIRLVLGQVVVDGDHVDALAGQGAQVRGHRGDQGLALAGLHLGDPALVERDAAHDLHVEGAQAQDAPRRLADGGEGLDQDVVEGLPVGEAVLELLGLGLQLFVRELFEVLGQGVDLGREAVELLERSPFAGAKDLVDQ